MPMPTAPLSQVTAQSLALQQRKSSVFEAGPPARPSGSTLDLQTQAFAKNLRCHPPPSPSVRDRYGSTSSLGSAAAPRPRRAYMQSTSSSRVRSRSICSGGGSAGAPSQPQQQPSRRTPSGIFSRAQSPARFGECPGSERAVPLAARPPASARAGSTTRGQPPLPRRRTPSVAPRLGRADAPISQSAHGEFFQPERCAADPLQVVPGLHPQQRFSFNENLDLSGQSIDRVRDPLVAAAAGTQQTTDGAVHDAERALSFEAANELERKRFSAHLALEWTRPCQPPAGGGPLPSAAAAPVALRGGSCSYSSAVTTLRKQQRPAPPTSSGAPHAAAVDGGNSELFYSTHEMNVCDPSRRRYDDVSEMPLPGPGYGARVLPEPANDLGPSALPQARPWGHRAEAAVPSSCAQPATASAVNACCKGLQDSAAHLCRLSRLVWWGARLVWVLLVCTLRLLNTSYDTWSATSFKEWFWTMLHGEDALGPGITLTTSARHSQQNLSSNSCVPSSEARPSLYAREHAKSTTGRIPKGRAHVFHGGAGRERLVQGSSSGHTLMGAWRRKPDAAEGSSSCSSAVHAAPVVAPGGVPGSTRTVMALLIAVLVVVCVLGWVSNREQRDEFVDFDFM